MNENCIFCKIVSGEIAAEKIYEDGDVLAFMDMSPVSRGHVLVIPKLHSADISETSDGVLLKVISATKLISTAVMKAVQADGFTVTTNKGEASGQSVFHLHFHVIPRFKNDGLPLWPHQKTDASELTKIANEIKKQL